jgi:hypothetical protein
VTRSATFEADGIPESEAVALLRGAFELNRRASQHFLVASAPGQAEDPSLPPYATHHNYL